MVMREWKPVSSERTRQAKLRFRSGRTQVKSALRAATVPGKACAYEAVVNATAPQVTAKLGSCILPMRTERIFYSFVAGLLSAGPKSPSLGPPGPSVRCGYVELTTVAVAYWGRAHGKRSVFDEEWSPRIGASWAGVEKLCVRIVREKEPLVLADVWTFGSESTVSAAVSGTVSEPCVSGHSVRTFGSYVSGTVLDIRFGR